MPDDPQEAMNALVIALLAAESGDDEDEDDEPKAEDDALRAERAACEALAMVTDAVHNICGEPALLEALMVTFHRWQSVLPDKQAL
jgi:hypothetical protein